MLIKKEKTSFIVDPDGIMSVRTMKQIIDTNDTGATDPVTGDLLPDELISEKLERSVINPTSADYNTKIDSIVSKLNTEKINEAAQLQASVISQNEAIINKNARIAEVEAQVIARDATIAARPIK